MFKAIIENQLSPTRCRKRDKMIIEVINTYDPITGKFQLGRESMELTCADMISIFGMSCGNESVSHKYGCKEKVKLVARREISESRLTTVPGILKKRSTSFSGKGGIKIKKPRLTELTNENEGEILDRAFRSSLRGIVMLIKELNLKICRKEVLKRTLFWGVFEVIIEKELSPTRCHKRDKMIIEKINSYEPVTRKFQLGRESMELTRTNMVSIFGISCGNESISFKYGCKEEVKLVARREISESRLTSTSLKQLLKKYVGSDEKDDVEKVACFLYLCAPLPHIFLPDWNYG
ncbi:hypothetical protein Vadar_034698 [Vaccinium darrowii]|nr:hypothetical protein Vadar_034698 [Vaccinium darrowii]